MKIKIRDVSAKTKMSLGNFSGKNLAAFSTFLIPRDSKSLNSSERSISRNLAYDLIKASTGV